LNKKHVFQIDCKVVDLKAEKCFHVELEPGTELKDKEEDVLRWIFKSPQQCDGITRESSFKSGKINEILIEVGPRFNFSTAESTNSVSICHSLDLKDIKRIETSIRYLITLNHLKKPISAEEEV
jgi:phosphoribosylformylglycinamidine synthase